MASWLGSASFVLFSALFGCLLGIGFAACRQAMRDKKQSRKHDKHT